MFFVCNSEEKLGACLRVVCSIVEMALQPKESITVAGSATPPLCLLMPRYSPTKVSIVSIYSIYAKHPLSAVFHLYAQCGWSK